MQQAPAEFRLKLDEAFEPKVGRVGEELFAEDDEALLTVLHTGELHVGVGDRGVVGRFDIGPPTLIFQPNDKTL